MKIEILNFKPELIEYFVDSKTHPKLIQIFPKSHCVFIDMHGIVKITHYLGTWEHSIKTYMLGWWEDVL